MWTYHVHMKTATLRDLRNDFGKLEAWLKEGETIGIRRRQTLVAVLSRPDPLENSVSVPLPDFAERRKQLGGSRTLTRRDLEATEAFEMDGQEG